ncbi:MAG: sigma-54 dependent transcriptional regulator [Myxococcota bacterium]
MLVESDVEAPRKRDVDSPRGTILLFSLEDGIRRILSGTLSDAGYRIRDAGCWEHARMRCDDDTELVVVDLEVAGASGAAHVSRFKTMNPEVPIIALATHEVMNEAIASMRQGANDVLIKPVDPRLAESAIQRALDMSRSQRELKRLRQSIAEEFAPDRIIGVSAKIREVKQLLTRIAHTPSTTVLITGESGTGKDLAAKAIHYCSARVDRRFVNITCSALPEALLESELFGHERGAFTDAKERKRGLLEVADGGTVFLDEVGEMTPALQAKLLRFLEDWSFKRVGGQDDIRVNVRVVAATHRDLSEAVRDGRFRDDLYYRLNVLPLALPPLRERAEDIPLLVEHFISRFNAEFKKAVRGVSKEAAKALQTYPWPGNIRELKNLVERAMLLAEREDVLQLEHFMMPSQTRQSATPFSLPATGCDLDHVERSLVEQALERARWNQTEAAKLLHLHRDQIRYRIKKFGLQAPTRH